MPKDVFGNFWDPGQNHRDLVEALRRKAAAKQEQLARATPPLKAIETSYKGYRFRSRLEARWAVFFDALLISWEYEPEGFVLKDGTKYLPDFKLDDDFWVEVKPTTSGFEKAAAFGKELPETSAIILLDGVPEDERDYPYISSSPHIGQLVFIDCGEKYSPIYYGEYFSGLSSIRAVTAARSARFEFANAR